MPRISSFERFLRLRRRAKSFESGRAGWRLARYEPDELPDCLTRHPFPVLLNHHIGFFKFEMFCEMMQFGDIRTLHGIEER